MDEGYTCKVEDLVNEIEKLCNRFSEEIKGNNENDDIIQVLSIMKELRDALKSEEENGIRSLSREKTALAVESLNDYNESKASSGNNTEEVNNILQMIGELKHFTEYNLEKSVDQSLDEVIIDSYQRSLGRDINHKMYWNSIEYYDTKAALFNSVVCVIKPYESFRKRDLICNIEDNLPIFKKCTRLSYFVKISCPYAKSWPVPGRISSQAWIIRVPFRAIKRSAIETKASTHPVLMQYHPHKSMSWEHLNAKHCQDEYQGLNFMEWEVHSRPLPFILAVFEWDLTTEHGHFESGQICKLNSFVDYQIELFTRRLNEGLSIKMRIEKTDTKLCKQIIRRVLGNAFAASSSIISLEIYGRSTAVENVTIKLPIEALSKEDKNEKYQIMSAIDDEEWKLTEDVELTIEEKDDSANESGIDLENETEFLGIESDELVIVDLENENDTKVEAVVHDENEEETKEDDKNNAKNYTNVTKMSSAEGELSKKSSAKSRSVKSLKSTNSIKTFSGGSSRSGRSSEAKKEEIKARLHFTEIKPGFMKIVLFKTVGKVNNEEMSKTCQDLEEVISEGQAELILYQNCKHLHKFLLTLASHDLSEGLVQEMHDKGYKTNNTMMKKFIIGEGINVQLYCGGNLSFSEPVKDITFYMNMPEVSSFSVRVNELLPQYYDDLFYRGYLELKPVTVVESKERSSKYKPKCHLMDILIPKGGVTSEPVPIDPGWIRFSCIKNIAIMLQNYYTQLQDPLNYDPDDEKRKKQRMNETDLMIALSEWIAISRDKSQNEILEDLCNILRHLGLNELAETIMNMYKGGGEQRPIRRFSREKNLSMGETQEPTMCDQATQANIKEKAGCCSCCEIL